MSLYNWLYIIREGGTNINPNSNRFLHKCNRIKEFSIYLFCSYKFIVLVCMDAITVLYICIFTENIAMWLQNGIEPSYINMFFIKEALSNY